MAGRLGENIQREWDAEPDAGKLWDALQCLRQNQAIGVALLTDLADGGSALAMMHLGHFYVRHDDPSQLLLGEQWLKKSAECGSIEGRLQLAVHYERQKDWANALSEFKDLATLGYSPAMYALGALLYCDDFADRSVTDAIHYLKMAKRAGHLPAMALLSRIYGKESYGLVGKIASHCYCLAKIPALAWYLMRYPNSDRLRRG